MRAISQGATRRPALPAADRARTHERPGRRGAEAGAAALIGAVLAGGASTRFGGRPKGLERVGGKRLIDRVADAMRCVVSDLVLISNEPDAGKWLAGVTARPDDRRERGSLVGIHTALRAAQPEPVLVVAWDMPFVEPDLLSLIVARLESSAYAAVPESAQGIEATCAAYRTACLPLVERLLDAGTMKLSRFVEALPEHVPITVADFATIGNPERLFFNVNTAADLARAEAMLASSR